MKTKQNKTTEEVSLLLIVNPGSTSTKYKLFNGAGNVFTEHNFKISEVKIEKKFLSEITDLEKIAIRVVHGGDISETSKITESLKKKITEYIDFAPIHNIRAIETINKMTEIFPGIAQYACFDTAFHTSIPEYLSTYALPTKLAKKHKLKKYGFHGLAVQSALQKLAEKRKLENLKFPKNIIFAHLGGGCSITAVQDKKSLYTSMGLTPISGIMMTTRIGDVDSDLDKILAHKENKSIDEISHILNFESGFYGMTGSKDTLKIFNAAAAGKKREKLAFDVFVAEITEKIWGYAGLMQGIDTVVFSGGIGYGNADLRNAVFKNIKKLGLDKNDIYAIDVDEELVMFNDLQKFMKSDE